MTSDLLTCPKCLADIPADSAYCDQCGAALLRCPQCGKLRKGKYCPDCGVATVAAAASSAAPTLVCEAHGISVTARDGGILGRTCGDWPESLSRLPYLSSTHARLDRTPDGWTVTDLGSTNGTAVNGRPCSPTLPFKSGDTLTLAKMYKFAVK